MVWLSDVFGSSLAKSLKSKEALEKLDEERFH